MKNEESHDDIVRDCQICMGDFCLAETKGSGSDVVLAKKWSKFLIVTKRSTLNQKHATSEVSLWLLVLQGIAVS